MFYTNADNLINKIDEHKVRFHLKPFDVLVVTEVYPNIGCILQLLKVRYLTTGRNLLTQTHPWMLFSWTSGKPLTLCRISGYI